MPHPAPLPDPLARHLGAGHAVNVRGARRLGVGPERLRRRDLCSPRAGVRMAPPAAAPAGEPPWDSVRREHRRHAEAEAARLPPGAVLSHVTAAVLQGLPLHTHRVQDAPVHVSVRTDAQRRRHSGVIVHPSPRDMRRTTTVDGIPVTHPVDTWCALAAMLSVDELVVIGDHLVRREDPAATPEQLDTAVRRYAGRHGVHRLRAALELVRPRTDSPQETLLRLSVVRAGIREPAVNASVRDRAGEHVKFGDLVFDRYRVLLEYDGEQHRTDDTQYARDVWQLERATAAGWLVIRTGRSTPSPVLPRLLTALRSRGYPGPPTFPP